MAAEKEIERLLVRLVGDATNYQRMLKDAEKSTSGFEAVLQRGAAVTRSVENATERYARETKELSYLLKTNAISQETFNRAMARATREHKRATGGLASTHRSLQRLKTGWRAVTSVLGQFGLVGAASIGVVGTAMVKMAADFEAQMAKIIGLVGVARSQVEAWSREILRLAPEVAKGPKELGDALFFISSAGLRGTRAMDTLKIAAKASAAGLGEVKTVADVITSALNAYGAANLSASRAADILTATIREGKLETDSLAPVMGRVLPMASAMGISFEDVAGSMAVMSRTGTDAAEGITSIQALLMTLQAPTDAARDALKTVGLNFQMLRDIARGPGGLVDVLRLLKRTFGENEEALATIIPNVRALRGAMNILAQDSEKVDDVIKGVQESTGDMQKAFDTAAGTAKFKFAEVLSELKVTATELGTTALPALTDAIGTLNMALKPLTETLQFLDWLNKVPSRWNVTDELWERWGWERPPVPEKMNRQQLEAEMAKGRLTQEHFDSLVARLEEKAAEATATAAAARAADAARAEADAARAEAAAAVERARGMTARILPALGKTIPGGRELTSTLHALAPAFVRLGEAIDREGIRPLERYFQRTARLRVSVAELTRSLQMQVATFGMSSEQAEIHRLKMLGATEAQLAAARAAAATLEGLRAAKEADQTLDKLQDKANIKITFSVVEAAAAGSAEALARLEEFRTLAGGQKTKGRGGLVSVVPKDRLIAPSDFVMNVMGKGQNRVETLLDRIAVAVEAELDKPGLDELEPAGLN